MHLAATGDPDLCRGRRTGPSPGSSRTGWGELPGVLAGVPSKGIRKLTGIESASRAARANSASTSCSSVSRSPAIRPEQGDSPADLALPMVSTRSSYVWVETTWSWWDSAVLMLWLWRRPRPAQPLALAVLEQPRQAQTSTSGCLLLSARVSSVTCRCRGPTVRVPRRPGTRLAPPRRPAPACSRVWSAESQEHFRIGAVDPSAWLQ